MDQDVWEETIREDADKKDVRSRNRRKRGVCTKEGKSVSTVKRRKRRSMGVCLRAVEEGIYLTVQVTTDSTSIFCGEEG